jgi:hypothetical protein
MPLSTTTDALGRRMMSNPHFEQLTDREEEIRAELGQVVATDVARRDQLNGQLTTILAARAIIEALGAIRQGETIDGEMARPSASV